MTKEAMIARKKEIRSKLQDTNAKFTAEELTAFETELRQLDADIEAIEKRQRMIDGLGGLDPTPEPEQRKKPGSDDEPDDKYDTKEYRKAFMKFAQTGVLAPEYRVDASTGTADVSAVIPTSILNEMISKMKVYGQIFSRVRKISIQGGVEVPILSLKPVATWMTGNTATDRQKLQANTKVQFSYYGLECRVAVDLIASTVSLAMFENAISGLIAEAMVKALDTAIIKGTGSGQPLGITVDPRVLALTAQVVTITQPNFAKWDAWKKQVFAKIPLAYRAGGEFFMASSTFEGQIDGMVDTTGQPVARVNVGITDGPQERFGGKGVVLVEDDIIAPYDTAAVGDIVAVFAKLDDYAINSNMTMQMTRWFDQDKNQWVDKAILIADGKILDPNGVIIVKKGAAT